MTVYLYHSGVLEVIDHAPLFEFDNHLPNVFHTQNTHVIMTVTYTPGISISSGLFTSAYAALYTV